MTLRGISADGIFAPLMRARCEPPICPVGGTFFWLLLAVNKNTARRPTTSTYKLRRTAVRHGSTGKGQEA
jgi:hypothetical protein